MVDVTNLSAGEGKALATYQVWWWDSEEVSPGTALESSLLLKPSWWAGGLRLRLQARETRAKKCYTSSRSGV